MAMTSCYGFSPRNGEVILKKINGVEQSIELRFSPRNGEVILKDKAIATMNADTAFQSPQWGSNSKVVADSRRGKVLSFSPRNGEVILN